MDLACNLDTTDTTRHHVPRAMDRIHAVGKLIFTYLACVEGSKASSTVASTWPLVSCYCYYITHAYSPHNLAHRLST
jgi:hypothetical protein